MVREQVPALAGVPRAVQAGSRAERRRGAPAGIGRWRSQAGRRARPQAAQDRRRSPRSRRKSPPRPDAARPFQAPIARQTDALRRRDASNISRSGRVALSESSGRTRPAFCLVRSQAAAAAGEVRRLAAPAVVALCADSARHSVDRRRYFQLLAGARHSGCCRSDSFCSRRTCRSCRSRWRGCSDGSSANGSSASAQKRTQ